MAHDKLSLTLTDVREVSRPRMAMVAALLFALATHASADSGTGHMAQMGSHMHAGAHMTFTDPRPATEGDLRRGREVLAALRDGIERFRENEAAIAAGYVPFLPTVPQDVYHFVSYPETGREYAGSFDPARPGSLLYVKGAGGYRLVGAMYSASERTTPAELERMIPLGVARWHAHVNICLPKGLTLDDLVRGEIGAGNPHLAGRLPTASGSSGLTQTLNERYGFMADGRFGFEGRIAERGECERAEGSFLPQAWGWMVHVYPFAGDDLAVAFGLDVP